MNVKISLDNMSKAERLLLYVNTRQSVLNERAVFSDGTIFFRNPTEPNYGDDIIIRIRTAKNNVDQVFLRYADEKVLMAKVISDSLFDYYEFTIKAVRESVAYYFELHVGKLIFYYNKRGVERHNTAYYNFFIVPDFKTPDWAKGAVMYQIMVDRFYNGDKSNDVVDNEYVYVGKKATQVKDWFKYPDADGIREFYGGDLQGVIQKLDYLKDLGVDAIYMNPIFVSPSNHKYDTQDYDAVDPHLGVIVNDGGEVLPADNDDNEKATKYIKRTTDVQNIEASNDLFARLVEEAHARNIRVILDGVFNHCGSFNKWMDKEKFYFNDNSYGIGAYHKEESPYRNYFNFYECDSWPNNNCYDGWWGYDTLPKLNYEGSKTLYQDILEVAKKWVSPPYNADGWRLDVAADLGYSREFNHKFWRDFRNAVKSANSEAIILAEHYGDPSDWLHKGDQWDSIMNYDAFMEPVSWFLTGMDKHSDSYREDLLGNYDAFFGAMNHNMSRFHSPSLYVAMNQISNHDHSRFLTRTNKKVGRTSTLGPEAACEDVRIDVMMEAVIMMMTWIGAPTIYYGDEAGLCGFTDPDNRRTYPWGKENKRLIDLHKKLIEMRNKCTVLKYGSIKFLYGEHNVISYGRFDKEKKFFVALNNSEDKKVIDIPVWELGINSYKVCEQVLESKDGNFSIERKYYTVEKGKVRLELAPRSAKIIREKNYVDDYQ